MLPTVNLGRVSEAVRKEHSGPDLHIDTMLPVTSLPKVRYPVRATSM